MADANNATAFGSGANAAGVNATAMGQGASALADNSSAYGNGASVAASHTSAAAFGAGATNTRANQQSFGTASNTYTMAGITSNASKAAQGAPTTIVTSNGAGDLAAYSVADLRLATQGDVSALNSRLNTLRRSLALPWRLPWLACRSSRKARGSR
jgi:hypothetical protein